MSMTVPMGMTMVVGRGMVVIVHAKTVGTLKMNCYSITIQIAVPAQNHHGVRRRPEPIRAPPEYTTI